MIESTVPASEIKKAGGLAKWLAKEVRKPSPPPNRLSAVLEPVRGDWLNLPAMPGIDEKPTPGTVNGMNRWEHEHARNLLRLLMAGEISGYFYERFRLDLGGKVKYIPDFFRLNNDGTFDVDEVKGFHRDDAMVKLKIAAAKYPQFTFRLWTKGRGGVWAAETIGEAKI